MTYLDTYNIGWETQSGNSEESMPLGGGDTGINVWVQGDQLLFYIGRPDSCDENNQLLKLGRVRISMNPNPFSPDGTFRQELKPGEGIIQIHGSSPQASARLWLWVEIHRPVIHVDIEANVPMEVEVQFECWRNSEREFRFDDKFGLGEPWKLDGETVVPGKGNRWAVFNLCGYPGKVVTYPDTVRQEDCSILWYHRNREDDLVFDKEVREQGMSEVREQLWNPLKDLTFGGIVEGGSMEGAGTEAGQYAGIYFTAWKLKSREAARRHEIAVTTHTARTATIEEWKESLLKTAESARRSKTQAWEQHQRWWKEFWERSYIVIEPERPDASSKAWQVGRNYQLFRSMLAGNAYGSLPTRFNGGLFTYDPGHVTWHNFFTPQNETPDWRAWGNSFTAQNQRLVYWPLLKSGDFEMMIPQFDFYRNALQNAELRTKTYWGHGGCSFTEQVESFGLPSGCAYGWKDAYTPGERFGGTRSRPQELEPGVQSVGAIRYLFVGQLEFAHMMLQYGIYSNRDISDYLPFIESTVRFYDEHYQYLEKERTGEPFDENGRLRIFPSSGSEAYPDATNPTDAVAGLLAVLHGLLKLPNCYVGPDKKKRWRDMLSRVPEIPVRTMHGKKTIAPVEHCSVLPSSPGCTIELYPLFPFDLYGLGRPDFQIALDTWTHGDLSGDQKRGFESWRHGGVYAARLGLADEAASWIKDKLSDSPRRFPTFWGPGDDWVPDHNWGGAGMVALQDMLLQADGDTIYLLPAWPTDWDVDFKLHAPQKTTVEGSVRKGSLVRFEVEPDSRRKDIVICNAES